MLTRRHALKGLASGLASAPLWRGLPVLAADGPSITVAYPADISSWDPIATGDRKSTRLNSSHT